MVLGQLSIGAACAIINNEITGEAAAKSDLLTRLNYAASIIIFTSKTYASLMSRVVTKLSPDFRYLPVCLISRLGLHLEP